MISQDNSTFYDELPVLESFFQVSDPYNYRSLPDDWLIGITDIENSTEAIKANKYKRVNILGASPIIGVINETDHKKLPFSFGGDGCAICFPSSLEDKVRSVFAASR